MSTVERFSDAADFAASLREWGATLRGEANQVLDASAEAVYDSIVHGSAVTGSPGQPVQHGDLRESWKIRRVSPTVIEVYSDSPYARAIEHNWKRVSRSQFKAASRLMGLKRLTKRVRAAIRKRLGGMRFRSGGSHSVKLTARGFPRLVQFIVRDNSVRAKGIGIDPYALRGGR